MDNRKNKKAVHSTTDRTAGNSNKGTETNNKKNEKMRQIIDAININCKSFLKNKYENLSPDFESGYNFAFEIIKKIIPQIIFEYTQEG